MKLEKGFKHFLIRTAVFVKLFIVFSVIIGTELYQYGLLEDWKIEIYGRIGYILLFSIAGFILMYRERLLKFKTFKIEKKDSLFLFLSFASLFLFYLFEKNAFKFEINLFSLILVHLLALSIFLFLALGIYGINFIKYFVKDFKKEIFYFLAFGLIVYPLMNLVFNLWVYFSFAVLQIVYFFLNFLGPTSVINSDVLIFNGFAVKIAEACSGIYSIFIFSALYIFAALLDWDKLNHKKITLMFIPAVAGAFLVNVLRVFFLMIIGAYVSKSVALGMYHSYTGMIFFLIYFGVFYKLSYGWMKR